MGLLSPSLDLADLAGCDLIIEAVFEDMDVKRDVFARLDRGGETRRGPRDQHVHIGRRPDRRGHRAAG